MRLISTVAPGVACVALGLLGACGNGASSRSGGSRADQVVNLYMWADELAPDTLANFEKQTGIRVNASYYSSAEMLESRMLAGNSGFDVVMPDDAFIQRHIRSGAYAVLDKGQLPHYAHLDTALMARVAHNDPGNAHAVIFDWGTMGIGYNKAELAKRLPGVSLDSWKLIFDPAIAAKLDSCGISLFDDPVGTVRLALIALERNPNDPRPQDLADAERLLHGIRPFIRNIDTATQIQALASGDVCVIVAYNGNVVQARKRALEAGSGIDVGYLIPREGSLLWFDLLSIPRDAPHPANAYRLIDYLLDPAVIAGISNYTNFANANVAATPLVHPAIASDPAVYPPADQQQRLFLQTEPDPAQLRAITRIWQKFRIGH